jgi:hypothetical protein
MLTLAKIVPDYLSRETLPWEPHIRQSSWRSEDEHSYFSFCVNFMNAMLESRLGC